MVERRQKYGEIVYAESMHRKSYRILSWTSLLDGCQFAAINVFGLVDDVPKGSQGLPHALLSRLWLVFLGLGVGEVAAEAVRAVTFFPE